MNDERPYIAVVGGSVATPESERLAEAVGGALGRGGAVLVCGGLGGLRSPPGADEQANSLP